MAKPDQKVKFPRIYTLHSQKGGVGKTSIALAIAGFASIHHKKKVLIIDADLTGVSLHDVFRTSNSKKVSYLNDLLLADPSKFAKITIGKSSRPKEYSLEKYCLNVPEGKKIFYLPGSPCYSDMMRIVPLISQEDNLHFFRFRLEELIEEAIIEGFGTIVIDHPPGLFGLSAATLSLLFDNEFKMDGVGSRIYAHSLLITTRDRSDYRAMYPALSELLSKCKALGKVQEMKSELDVIINKSNDLEGKDSLTDEMKLDLIYKDINEFPDKRKVDSSLREMLRERSKNVGPLICNFDPEFQISMILGTIQAIRDAKRGKAGGQMRWCMKLGKMLKLFSPPKEHMFG
jgi:MinD-like ATPase involved in chromosome partitioning or flagellar assembly